MPRTLKLTRPEQFKAIGDGTRMRILGRLAQGTASISELAAMLGMPRTTVGHHVGVLEQAGLVRVVGERRVRAVTERRYARTAPMFRLGDPEEDEPGDAADEQLHMYPLKHAIEEARAPTSRDEPFTSLIVRARMPAARAQRFAHLIEQLADEFAEGDRRGGATYGFAAAIYATDWQRGDDAV
ncbi:MAG: helix-turn-helix domain-containing protein [Chloroflexota bacterium]|nr:helix-turn-helix domain-containing protein [Chloroflexota bacterium]